MWHMATLTIEFSEDLQAKAQARAVEAGYLSLTAYVESLVREDVGLGMPLPERVVVRSPEELDAKLGEGLDGAAREVTPEIGRASCRERV